MAIKIPFVADVNAFLRGTSDMEDALEDVADSLDELGRTDTGNLERDLHDVGSAADTSTTAVEQLGDGLGDLARVDTTGVETELKEIGTAGDTAAEELERSFKSAFKTLKTEGRTASQQTRDHLKDTGDAGSETMREFKDEAKQNVAETVSSFDGSASSAVDAIQGTFGGLVSALGPAGVVGAAAVGVGIGLARNLFEKSKERAAEVAEAVADITGQLIDLGSTSLGVDQVNEQLKTLASTADDGKNSLQEIADQAADAGINYRDYARGLAGDSDAIHRSYEEVTKRVGELDQAERDLMHTRGATQDDVDRLIAGQLDEREALAETRKELLEQDATLDQASRTTELYNDAIAGSVDNTEAEAEALRDSNDQLREQAGLKSDAIATELDLIEARQETNKTIKDNGRNVDDNTKKGRDNIRALLDLASKTNAWADSQIEAGKRTSDVNKKMADQREAFIRTAEAAGYTKEEAKKLATQLGLMPRKKEINVTDNGTAKKTGKEIDDNIPDSKDVAVKVTYQPSQDLLRQIQRHLNSYTFKIPVDARPGQPV